MLIIQPPSSSYIRFPLGNYVGMHSTIAVVPKVQVQQIPHPHVRKQCDHTCLGRKIVPRYTYVAATTSYRLRNEHSIQIMHTPQSSLLFSMSHRPSEKDAGKQLIATEVVTSSSSTQGAPGSMHAYPDSPHLKTPPGAQVHEQQSPPSYPGVGA